jgi:hypothetical protein
MFLHLSTSFQSYAFPTQKVSSAVYFVGRARWTQGILSASSA